MRYRGSRRFCWPRLSGGCGDTFITGALEAWIASEEEDKPIDKVFLRGSQMGQIGGVLGVVLGTLLGNINLQMPLILGGQFVLVVGAGDGSHHARNQLLPCY